MRTVELIIMIVEVYNLKKMEMEIRQFCLLSQKRYHRKMRYHQIYLMMMKNKIKKLMKISQS
jgi:hypothetical protein